MEKTARFISPAVATAAGIARIFLTFFACLSFSALPAQNPETPDEYQFYLEEPAIEIMDLRHKHDCSPVNGRLSDDGRVIFMKGYSKGSHVYFKYMKADGTVVELTRSRCFIDPVIPFI